MKTIEPTILKGTRDFLPVDMARREVVMNKIKGIFARFGYDSIETPILCPAETILGKYGDEGDKLTYSFEDNGGRRVALPYDLTVPFARLVAANWRDLPMPFKRYQIQRVWRAEKPQKGRLREFYQCDIDIIGTRSLIAEAEVAKVIVTVFKALGFKEFVIKFNSRRLLNNVLKNFEIEGDKAVEVIRIIDKLNKVGAKVVVELLEEIGIKQAKELLGLLEPGTSNEESVKKLEAFDLEEISEFLSLCKALKVEESCLQFDASLARGLDYYTGISFEVYSKEADFGALCAGGRYDNLCGMFCKEDFSGVGVAFGFERIVLGLTEMGLLDDVSTNTRVLMTMFDEEASGSALQVYDELNGAGINSEIYFEADKLAKQFKYADKKGIPFVLIFGPDEIAKDEITVKMMKTGMQKSIPRKQLVSYLNSYYES